MTAPMIYPSKIMLVGEYGVAEGGSALTIPFTHFDARVRETTDIPEGATEKADLSPKYLAELISYIRSIPGEPFRAKPDPDLFSLYTDKYWLEINIPTGYGLGSSGAVSAAVYDLFFPEARSLSLPHQKEDLAIIESYFHGKSSGMDALTCHSGKTLYFKHDGSILPVKFNPSKITGEYCLFLLNSETRMESGSLVKHFLLQMKDPGYASSIRNEYLVINQKLIEALLGEREADPGLLFRVISDYQFTHFRKMIPDSMIDNWIEGQVSNEYYLKLNGSGGGYMLGITHQTSVENLQKRWKEQVIWIR